VTDAYRNPALDADARADDLLARMTLREKVNQLSGYMFFDTYWETNAHRSEAERIAYVMGIPAGDIVPPEGMGFVSTQLRDLPARLAAEKANEMQARSREATRHGIPIVIQDEGVHGLIGNGATVFPSALGMAASWNPELFERVAHAIGREAKVRGVNQLLSPTLNLGRDPRCGRTEETWGEDAHLASLFAVAFVRGVQSEGVICTPKHFAVNFEGDGGRDSEAAEVGERLLRELYFAPFERCVREARPWSLMAAYNSLNGRPCSGNRWLLTDVLRKEWGFDGYVVSDYHSIIHQMELHGTAATQGDCARQALEAGMEVEFPRTRTFGEPLLEEIRAGRVSEETIHEAARRVLKPRFAMGFFEDAPRDPAEAERATNCGAHRALALDIARQSVVMLRNEGGLLPLGNRFKRIAVIGPNADSIELGDYSWDLYTKAQVVTVYEGIKAAAPKGTEVRHDPGIPAGAFDESFRTAHARLKEVCDWADLIVAVTGTSVRDTREGVDRVSISMPAPQTFLFESVYRENTAPLVQVQICGSVLEVGHLFEHIDAYLHCWYPGCEGGMAIAEILFGAQEPSGRLPITIPKSGGFLPLCYNHKPSGRGFLYGKGAEFPFGFGLSHARFEYSDLKTRVSPSGEATAEFTLTNVGKVAGVEVPQLYVRDVLASVVRPLKELKAFERVELAPGESRRVRLAVRAEELMLWNARMERVFEAGEFDLMVGANCEDIRLRERVVIA